MSQNFRNSILALVPPRLQGDTATRFFYTIGLLIDAAAERLMQGMQARFPASAPEDALHYLGNDRNITRGPNEPSPPYRLRLQQAVPTWKNAGGARTILAQVAAYFTGTATPPLRLVSDSAVWHEWDWSTSTVTKTVVRPENWKWDSFTGTRWWRGWLIVDSSSGPWAQFLWGSTGGKWGARHATWGSTATVDDVNTLLHIVRDTWKPANVDLHNVIITFDSTLFRRTNAPTSNPNGNYDIATNRAAGAVYWPGGT